MLITGPTELDLAIFFFTTMHRFLEIFVIILLTLKNILSLLRFRVSIEFKSVFIIILNSKGCVL